MTYRVSFVSPTLSTIRPTPSRRAALSVHPFERAVSTLFHDAFPAAAARAVSTEWRPATDIVEDADGWTITLDLPGVSPDALDIVQEARRLTVRGSRDALGAGSSGTPDHQRRAQVERVGGAFERRFDLPESADMERLHAELAHGVLTVRIGKVAPAQARRITVQVGTPSTGGAESTPSSES